MLVLDTINFVSNQWKQQQQQQQKTQVRRRWAQNSYHITPVLVKDDEKTHTFSVKLQWTRSPPTEPLSYKGGSLLLLSTTMETPLVKESWPRFKSPPAFGRWWELMTVITRTVWTGDKRKTREPRRREDRAESTPGLWLKEEEQEGQKTSATGSLWRHDGLGASLDLADPRSFCLHVAVTWRGCGVESVAWSVSGCLSASVQFYGAAHCGQKRAWPEIVVWWLGFPA